MVKKAGFTAIQNNPQIWRGLDISPAIKKYPDNGDLTNSGQIKTTSTEMYLAGKIRFIHDYTNELPARGNVDIISHLRGIAAKEGKVIVTFLPDLIIASPRGQCVICTQSSKITTSTQGIESYICETLRHITLQHIKGNEAPIFEFVCAAIWHYHHEQ